MKLLRKPNFLAIQGASKMFIERRVNTSTGIVELWECRWDNSSQPAHKVFEKKIGPEQQATPPVELFSDKSTAICWSYGRTLGNIAVFSDTILGNFPAQSGNDAQLPCALISAGKFRNGALRWWCTTHQTHWGNKADLLVYEQSKEMRCANQNQPMNYVVNPYAIEVDENAEVGVWCSMPAAISTEFIENRAPNIHVHVRKAENGKKLVDRDFQAVSMRYSQETGLFRNEDITHVQITPPAAFDFVYCLENNIAMGCVNCSSCGYPHLDLAEYARVPHKKHFCGNCGRDSTWSKVPIASTPLKPLHDKYAHTLNYVTPDKELDLDDYTGCTYTVWASTPAILWTAHRPQEFGIHVHIHKDKKRVVDDTFGKVKLKGKYLEREELVAEMMRKTII
ncbi:MULTISPECIES: hypothetical protein [unclassified Pseudomonas]|uniref:hypothetical protein n=1 Tax=Pseudomonas sp. B21-041 TaxID=2895487 RepID=UPI00215F486F|nr:hypothetical protein [Pseudomonas sp. B21-041]UVL37236.1 hypothetical protein LOY43_12660 [Pseudomonas sp. B21-041]